MGLLVINTVLPLTPASREELKAIVGNFVERRPEELYVQARKITGEFGENSNEANDAAGLTGPRPPRKGLSKQYLRTWDQLKSYWLNEAQFRDLFRYN